MDKWLIWCDLNYEQEKLKKQFGNLCLSIDGSTDYEDKIKFEEMWRLGDVPILITKPKCFGFGMNWQVCHNVVFVGLSDSFEAYFQAIRRCWRFGQKMPVDVYIIISEREGAVLKNIKRKEADAQKMIAGMVEFTKKFVRENIKNKNEYRVENNHTKKLVLPDFLKLKVNVIKEVGKVFKAENKIYANNEMEIF
jgi:superfamily II DNA helicase RecQ